MLSFVVFDLLSDPWNQARFDKRRMAFGNPDSIFIFLQDKGTRPAFGVNAINEIAASGFYANGGLGHFGVNSQQPLVVFNFKLDAESAVLIADRMHVTI